MAKTIKEINERIKKGEAVVVTAEEIIDLVDKKGIKEASQEVDVVTTATFGPMCSSGAYFNIGHAKPKIKLGVMYRLVVMPQLKVIAKLTIVEVGLICQVILVMNCILKTFPQLMIGSRQIFISTRDIPTLVSQTIIMKMDGHG